MIALPQASGGKATMASEALGKGVPASGGRSSYRHGEAEHLASTASPSAGERYGRDLAYRIIGMTA